MADETIDGNPVTEEQIAQWAAKAEAVLVFDSGNELVIHAMNARPQMLDLLP